MAACSTQTLQDDLKENDKLQSGSTLYQSGVESHTLVLDTFRFLRMAVTESSPATGELYPPCTETRERSSSPMPDSLSPELLAVLKLVVSLKGVNNTRRRSLGSPVSEHAAFMSTV
ncbi:hypothetical protein MHYP_G00188860 [Metynnis hypsauchen]